MKISQSVARSGFINLKPYRKSITKAKIAPKRRAGSIMILIIFDYASSRARGSILETVTTAAPIGTITKNNPANRLVIKFDKDGVILLMYII
jgi:hypothetical protein